MTHFFLVPNETEWCSPAVGIYTGCPGENRYGYTIHNWTLASLNLFAVLVLTVSYSIRLVLTCRKTDAFFIVSSLTILYNIFVALWCILRQVPASPAWLTGLMFTLAGTCLVSALNYLLLVYQKVQNPKYMLHYDGLCVYKKAWIFESSLYFVVFLFYPLSTLGNTYTYAILARFFWLSFSVILIRIFGRGIYDGWKIRHVKRRVYRSIVCLCLMTLAALGPTLLATISPILIDHVSWLYHVFYSLVEGMLVGISLYLSWWSVAITQTWTHDWSATDQNSSGSKGSKYSGDSSSSIPV